MPDRRWQVILHALAKCNKPLSEVTHHDIWINATDTILKYYDNEVDFSNKESLGELKYLNTYKCSNCGLPIYSFYEKDAMLCEGCRNIFARINNPAFLSHDTTEYKNWVNNRANATHGSWQISSYEENLINLNLPYVVKITNIGIEYNNHYKEDISIFYPDFKIQIGYGTDPNAAWELIEFCNCISTSNYKDKYEQCHDKVGFVINKLSDIFIKLLTSPNNKKWPNPRLLSEILVHVWRRYYKICFRLIDESYIESAYPVIADGADLSTLDYILDETAHQYYLKCKRDRRKLRDIN